MQRVCSERLREFKHVRKLMGIVTSDRSIDLHRHAEIFERAGGIQAFVFDEDIGEFPAAQHRSESFAE